jgi:hypothetical protein
MMPNLRILLLATLSLPTLKAEEVPLDPSTGMKMQGDWEIVRNHCIICHSSQTFLRQRATEANWTSVLEWMQTKGGLWKLDTVVEKKIIEYLVTNYGPGPADNYRRAPIPATLMPLNPYATEAKIEAAAKSKSVIQPPKTGT